MKCSNIYCPNYHKEVCVDLAKHEAGDCPQHWETREDLEIFKGEILPKSEVEEIMETYKGETPNEL